MDGCTRSTTTCSQWDTATSAARVSSLLHVLACGKGAALSNRTAVDQWGLIRTSSPAIHVTVPRRKKPKVDGVIVHLTRQLTDADWTTKDGIPVTSVPRTLLDFAAVASRRQLVRAIEQ